MNTSKFFGLALVIITGLESLYSSALERPWAYEFPFKLPFASHDIIHRTFPIRIKYTKDTKQPENASFQQERPLSDPTANNGIKDENKQTEEFEPKVEVEKPDGEKMDNKEYFEGIQTLKQNNINYQQEANGKTSDTTSSNAFGSSYSQPVVRRFHNRAFDSDSGEEDCDEDHSKEDTEEEESEDDAGRGSGGGYQEKIEQPIQRENKKFPYRLIMQVMNPEGQIFHKMRAGYVSELQEQLFKKDNIFYFLRSLREKRGKKEKREDSDDLKTKETQDDIAHPAVISSPVLRYSSQVMDKKGNLYRREKILRAPISLTRSLENEYKADAQKAISNDKHIRKIETSAKDDEEYREESIKDNEQFQRSRSADEASNTENEALPARKRYWQDKPQKKQINKQFKLENSNIKLDEVDKKSEPESGIAKDDDEDEEREKVQKVVIIRPSPRVFQTSVDIISPEKSEIASLEMEPTVETNESQTLPYEKSSDPKYLFMSEQTKFALKHILNPLKRILNMKIFGHPGRIDADQ